jgi:hypothetical protein
MLDRVKFSRQLVVWVLSALPTGLSEWTLTDPHTRLEEQYFEEKNLYPHNQDRDL